MDFGRLVVLLLCGSCAALAACAVEDSDGGSSGTRDAGDTGRPGRGDASNDASADLEPPEGCGDGQVLGDEDCDGNASVDVTCGDLGLGNGLVRCGADCRFDFSECSTCGNGRLDGAEECDTEGIAGACTQVGLGNGSLYCNSDCRFDTRQCSTCGNGVLDGDESCDGTVFRESCASQGLGGTPTCNGLCQAAFTTCYSLCNNGQIDEEVGEACDGTDVGGATCESLGYDVPANPGCTSTCQLDPAPCTGFQDCGNGTREGDEACDGDDVPTCRALGFEWGQTQCDSWCEVDSTRCSDTAPFCGVIDFGWDHDTGSLGPSTFSRETDEINDELHYYMVAGAYFQAGEGVTVDVTSSDFDPWLLIFDGSCTLIAEDRDGSYSYGPASSVTSLSILVTSQEAGGTGDFDIYVQWNP